MLRATLFLLALSLALVAPGFSARTCVLTGLWVNDLGSNMTIGPLNGKGEFTGTYHTAVTATTNKIQRSPLQGSQHRINQNSQPTFGFTVNWNFSDSVTVFTGQCFVDEDGKEVLKTMWLLRSRVDNIKDDWKATRVGINVFTRLRSQKEFSEGAGASAEPCEQHIPRYAGRLPSAEMLRATLFLLALSLALVAPGFSARTCVLTGLWVNDLGSNMTIGPLNEKYEFTGTYNTSVSDTKKKILPSPLQGSQHNVNQNSQPTFGFTVNWNFSDSTTVFTGQCFVDEDGKETLKTMWLLRSRVDNIKDDWKATRVGINVFTRLRLLKE
ncbi:uncharacterized protein J5M81_015936 [Pluvialis apricaria]